MRRGGSVARRAVCEIVKGSKHRLRIAPRTTEVGTTIRSHPTIKWVPKAAVHALEMRVAVMVVSLVCSHVGEQIPRAMIPELALCNPAGSGIGARTVRERHNIAPISGHARAAEWGRGGRMVAGGAALLDRGAADTI